MKKTIVLLICTSLLMGLLGCGGLDFSADFDASGLEELLADGSEETQQDATDMTENEDSEATEPQGPTESGTTEDNTTWYSYDNLFSDNDTEPAVAAKPLNATEVYSKLEYVPEMFYGEYYMSFVEDDVYEAPYTPCKSFAENCEWVSYEELFGKEDLFERQVATMPHYMCAGYGSASWTALLTLEEYEWCQLRFATKSEAGEISYESVMADYSISGDTITYHILDNYNYDSTTEELTYEFSDVYLTYEFEFRGPKLTLRSDKESVDLFSSDFCLNDLQFLMLTASDVTVSNGMEMIDNIQSLTFGHENYDDYDYFYVEVDEGGKEPAMYYGSMKLSEDGLCSFSYTDGVGKVHAHEYVIFFCDEDGFIFTDGEKTYYYLHTLYTDITDDFLAEMNVNIAEEDRELLESMTEEEIQSIYAKREALFSDLLAAFEAENIAVTINEKTGELALDSEVLFPVDGDTLSEEGKVVVDEFISVFMKVLGMPKYSGFISEIVIEGHTDTSGDYDYNLSLSQRRADAVKEYCLTGASLSAEDTNQLLELLSTQGCSYDEPVYNENGEVDMDASRRVSFVFYIDLSAF